MRLSTIEFQGYKRLVDAECNVDGKVIAFVGPNESGKSSVLQGLQWLTDEPRQLRIQEQNRDRPPESETMVVRARYRLDDGDIEALNRLDLDVDPAISRQTVTEFRFSGRVDGTRMTGLTTTVKRNAAVFKAASSTVVEIGKLIDKVESLPDEERLGPVEDILRPVAVLLDPADPDWNDERIRQLSETVSAIDQITAAVDAIDDPPEGHVQLRAELVTLARQVSDSAEAGRLADPATAMRNELISRVPKFVLFTDNDRNIAAIYPLADEGLRADPPAPLRNLLYVAGTTVARH